jgi:hypothetical protein
MGLPPCATEKQTVHKMTRNLSLIAIYVAGMVLWLVPYLVSAG